MPEDTDTTPDGRARLRTAAPEELPEVLSVLTEAAERMVAEGNREGWPRPFPASLVAGPLGQGAVYLVELEPGTVLGTVTLLWEDVQFWGERPPDAGYVHRLAIRTRFAGQGWGRRVLEWADARVRQRHRKFLRLDCASSNPRLRRYYEQLGFRAVGEVAHQPLRFPVTLYERDVR